MPVCSATVIPAEGHPAKYYFVGTPEAGIHNPYRLEGVATLRVWIPAFAGMTMVAGATTMVGEAK